MVSEHSGPHFRRSNVRMLLGRKSNMRILLSADWQFDTYDRLSTLLPEGITSRLDEFIRCFEWAVDVARSEKCDAFAMLGDIFNARVAVDVTVLHKVCRAVFDVAEEFDFYVMAGNHDAALRTPALNSLQTFAGSASVLDRVALVRDGVAFVPWTSDLEQLREWIDTAIAGKAKYLFSHCLVEGAVPKAKGLPVSYLRPEKFKRVFLGDVHDPVKVPPNIQYCGAPLQINFGDEGKPRGVWVLDTATDKVQFFQNPVSRLFHVLRSTAAFTERKAAIRPTDYVRVECDRQDEAQAITKALGHVKWLETNAVETVEDAPRLAVRSQDSHEDVLRRYCEHVNARDVDGLVRVGLDILGEAKT